MESRGFTLIELMIVIAILAILTAIAVPIYTSQVEKSRRAEAVSELLVTAQALERCYTRSNSYSGCVSSPFDTDNGYYEIAVTASGTTYDLTATAKGAQSGDDCSPFELDHLGNRDAGSTNDRCWGSD